MHHSNHRIGFKSKFGAIAALAGSAVGLEISGNFPMWQVQTAEELFYSSIYSLP